MWPELFWQAGVAFDTWMPPKVPAAWQLRFHLFPQISSILLYG